MRFNVFIIFLSMSLLAGCMAYKGEDLVLIETLPQENLNKEKPYLLIDANFNKSSSASYGYSKEDDYAEDNYTNNKSPSKSEENFKKIVKEEIDKSGYFNGYSFTDNGGNEKSLSLQLSMSIETQEGAHNASVFFSIYTLGILPGYLKHDFKLKGALYNEKDELLKEYVYTDTMTSWYELFLLPFAFTKSPKITRQKITANMVRHLLKDMKEDNII